MGITSASTRTHGRSAFSRSALPSLLRIAESKLCAPKPCAGYAQAVRLLLFHRTCDPRASDSLERGSFAGPDGIAPRTCVSQRRPWGRNPRFRWTPDAGTSRSAGSCEGAARKAVSFGPGNPAHLGRQSLPKPWSLARSARSRPPPFRKWRFAWPLSSDAQLDFLPVIQDHRFMAMRRFRYLLWPNKQFQRTAPDLRVRAPQTAECRFPCAARQTSSRAAAELQR